MITECHECGGNYPFHQPECSVPKKALVIVDEQPPFQTNRLGDAFSAEFMARMTKMIREKIESGEITIPTFSEHSPAHISHASMWQSTKIAHEPCPLPFILRSKNKDENEIPVFKIIKSRGKNT